MQLGATWRNLARSGATWRVPFETWRVPFTCLIRFLALGCRKILGFETSKPVQNDAESVFSEKSIFAAPLQRNARLYSGRGASTRFSKPYRKEIDTSALSKGSKVGHQGATWLQEGPHDRPTRRNMVPRCLLGPAFWSLSWDGTDSVL